MWEGEGEGESTESDSDDTVDHDRRPLSLIKLIVARMILLLSLVLIVGSPYRKHQTC